MARTYKSMGIVVVEKRITIEQILNTLGQCGFSVLMEPMKMITSRSTRWEYRFRIANAWGVIATEKSRTSAVDALRRAWKRKKVQKIIKQRSV